MQNIASRVVVCILLFSLSLTVAAETKDPWEGMNRQIFAFNDVADRFMLKPLAKGYKKVTPSIVDRSIANIFSNIGEVKNFAHDLLQGKPKSAMIDSGRFVINSTVGLMGIFDVASHIGLEREPEDFGQTLAVWGVDSGPYLMLPFLGPSTLRDGVGYAADNYVSVLKLLEPERLRYGLTALDLIQVRAGLLSSEELLSGDRYTFLRDAYLQRRQFLISDGEYKDDFADEDFESFDF
ncbi:MAG: MlaA family lipoprotein [Spongiibacteraceae bacterium]